MWAGGQDDAPEAARGAVDVLPKDVWAELGVWSPTDAPARLQQLTTGVLPCHPTQSTALFRGNMHENLNASFPLVFCCVEQ